MEKTTIQENNYTTTTTNAGLYNDHFSGISFSAEPVQVQPSSSPKPTYTFEFQDLNDLIDNNRDYQLIDQQLRLDRIATRTGNQQQANIIIRKD